MVAYTRKRLRADLVEIDILYRKGPFQFDRKLRVFADA